MRSIIIICCFITANPVKAQMPDSVKNFIGKALNLMEQHSVFSAGLNWKNIRDTANALSKNAATFKEAAPGIQYAFNALGDKHGWLVFGDEEYRNPAFRPDTGRISQNIKQAASKGPKIYAGIVKKEYAYISIPFFGGQTEAQMTAFAQRRQDSLFTVINENTKGIIIDLRLNAGGNMFPMFAGLSNVLGETDFAIYPTAIKDSIEKNSITNNGVAVNGRVITPLPKTYGDLSAHPVALVIGPVTGSAGECLAAGFIGRDKTALIGETTAGYTTANDGFFLHGNDYGMVLAVGYLRDRYGNVYPENVKPDIEVLGGDDFFNPENDKKIQAAVKWIDLQK
ncbi:MAG: hypothetical protein IPG38_11090 [Chitinophagaceae bacterium]|nr:hypothetical protein [Chitinophagaceae bacterium]